MYGMTRMDRQPRGFLDRAGDGVDVREIQPRMIALRVEIQRQRDEIHVA